MKTPKMRYFFFLFIFITLSCKKKDIGVLEKSTPPLSPVELKGSLISLTEVKLEWQDKSTNEKGFKIERKTSVSEFTIVKTLGSDTTTYFDNSLQPNTSYTYRVLAFNDAGSSNTYTNEVTIKTVSLPVVTTKGISDTSFTTAKSGGNIISDGALPISERGVIWSTQLNPTIDLNSKIQSGNGIGEFTSDLVGLLPGTTYYVRAYAKNSEGVGYGNDLIFKTKNLTTPIVETSSISSIQVTNALSGGNVISDGGSPVTSRGIVWSTTKPIESLLETRTINGSGVGEFSSVLNNLSPNTPYYVRAYATNNQGTSFGTMLNFTTSSYFINGNGVTDIEGNKYKTVIIGNQEWMAENLKTTKLQNGDALINGGITNNWRNYCTSDISAYADYSGSSILGEQFGRLYNFFAVNDTRKLCPTGWHVPSLSEWNLLESTLGASDATNKMKSTQGWSPAQFNGNNYSGFSALPAGASGYSGYGGLNFNATFWTSTENLPRLQFPKSYFIVFVSESPTLSKPIYDNYTGGSVRCVKD